MSNSLIKTQQTESGILSLTFNRPEKLNALSTPMMDEFDAALQNAAVDDSVKVIILRGAGDKAFVAGADIGEYQGGVHKAFNAYQRNSRRVFDFLEQLAKPTIAVIDGFALGGGLEIALCCDLIICTEAAQLGLPEGQLGLSPGGGGTQRLTRAIGKYATAELLLAGWRISGERAYQLGLACDCCKAEDLEATIQAKTRGLLKVAPLAQAQMKYLMREAIDLPIEAAKTLEQQILFELYMSDDGQEGINAFIEKRPPQFRGQ